LRAPVLVVRREAAFQLGRIGKDGKDAVPALIKALDDSDQQVSSLAISALANIGPDATEAIPALLEGLKTRRGRASGTVTGNRT
jgi:HEAT repeat protein